MVTRISRSQRRVAGQFLLLLLAATLTACASNPAVKRPSVGGGAEGGQYQYGQKGMGEESDLNVAKLDSRALEGIPKSDRRRFVDPDSLLSVRTIHFAFDSARIPPRYHDVIQAHAEYLANHPKVDLRLEGHTDPRGTREYNLALGARRAESVEQALIIAGASPDQLTTLSFGEEMLAVPGVHTPQAYAKDRRVELVYVDKPD